MQDKTLSKYKDIARKVEEELQKMQNCMEVILGIEETDASNVPPAGADYYFDALPKHYGNIQQIIVSESEALHDLKRQEESR